MITKYFFVALFILMASWSFADDLVPHTFEPGDVISADVLNEIVESIARTKRLLTVDDLLGEWEGKAYLTSYYSPSAVEGWTLSQDGLYMVLDGVTITFTDDGDNTYSLSTSAPNPFDRVVSDPCISDFELCENLLFFNRIPINGQSAFSIERIGDAKIKIFNIQASNASNDNPVVILNKKNTSPLKSSGLSAVVDGLTVTLNWTDNSDDETGFKILRKGSVKGGFSVITTTGADVITYEDTVPEASRYWYRVKATNANGDSMGTKVVKVIVTED